MGKVHKLLLCGSHTVRIHLLFVLFDLLCLFLFGRGSCPEKVRIKAKLMSVVVFTVGLCLELWFVAY